VDEELEKTGRGSGKSNKPVYHVFTALSS
jgi:hypothetical protein